MTDQSMDTTEIQLGEPLSFIGLTYSNMGEGLLVAAGMAQRQGHHQSTPEHG